MMVWGLFDALGRGELLNMYVTGNFGNPDAAVSHFKLKAGMAQKQTK